MFLIRCGTACTTKSISFALHKTEYQKTDSRLLSWNVSLEHTPLLVYTPQRLIPLASCETRQIGLLVHWLVYTQQICVETASLDASWPYQMQSHLSPPYSRGTIFIYQSHIVVLEAIRTWTINHVPNCILVFYTKVRPELLVSNYCVTSDILVSAPS